MANAITAANETARLPLGQALYAYGQTLGTEHPDYVESASEGMASLRFTVQGDPWELKAYVQSDEADRELAVILVTPFDVADEHLDAAYRLAGLINAEQRVPGTLLLVGGRFQLIQRMRIAHLSVDPRLIDSMLGPLCALFHHWADELDALAEGVSSADALYAAGTARPFHEGHF